MDTRKTERHWSQVVWFYVLAVLLFPSTLLIALSVSPLSANVSTRISGVAFQILGFLTVAASLASEVDEVGKRPGLLKRVQGLIYRIADSFGFTLERKSVLKRWSETLEAEEFSFLYKKASPGASLEKRVEMLEKQQEQLSDRTKETHRFVRQVRTELEKEIKSVRKDMSEQVKKLRERDKHLAIGTIHQEVAGLWWFLLGAVLTSFPAVV